MIGGVVFCDVVVSAHASAQIPDHVARQAMISGNEVQVAAIVFGTGFAVLFPLVRALARRIENKGAPVALPLGDIQDRLDRIERSVEAISVEVERVSEGQRFVTKLLAEKTTPPLPPAAR